MVAELRCPQPHPGLYRAAHGFNIPQEKTFDG